MNIFINLCIKCRVCHAAHGEFSSFTAHEGLNTLKCYYLITSLCFELKCEDFPVNENSESRMVIRLKQTDFFDL